MRNKISFFLMILTFAVAANAAVSSYEGFGDGYDPNTTGTSILVGTPVLGSGYVENATWNGGGDTIFQSVGMTYPGLLTEGGSILTQNGSDLYADLDLSDEGPFAGIVSNGIIGGDDMEGKVYISFLIAGDSDNAWGGLTLYRSGGEVILFGRTYTNPKFSATIGNGDPLKDVIGDPGIDFDTNNTHMIVVKIEYNSGSNDEVSIWLDPDMTANGADQNPAIRSVVEKGDLSFDRAVFRGQGFWHYDELRIGKAWRDVVGDTKSAIAVSPLDGEKGVFVDSDLVWLPGEDATPLQYKVYLSGVSDQLSAGDLVATTTTPSFDPPIDFDKDKTYYWRVDSVVGPNPLTDPNDFAMGDVWSFETELSLPVIDSVTNIVFGEIGETVTLVVDANDPLGGGLDYAWYLGAPGDTPIPVGTNSENLDVEIIDSSIFANLYWCEVTNTSGSIESEAMSIREKLLLAHWPLESDPDPNSNSTVAATPDSSFNFADWNSGANVQEVPGVVGTALRFYDAALLVDPLQSSYFDPMNEFMSVSCWIKADYYWSKIESWTPFVSRNGEAEGWQLRDIWGSQSAGLTTRGTDNSDGSITGGRASGRILDDARWHFLVGTFDSNAGVKKVYVDGVLRATDTTGSSTIKSSTLPVMVGARAYGVDNYGNYVRNLIFDEVKLYNYPLTATEVADAYVAVTGTLCVIDYPADLTGDCKVDIDDFAALASSWMYSSSYPDDISFD